MCRQCSSRGRELQATHTANVAAVEADGYDSSAFQATLPQPQIQHPILSNYSKRVQAPDPSSYSAKDLKVLVKYHVREGYSKYNKKEELLVAYNEHKSPLSDSDDE